MWWPAKKVMMAAPVTPTTIHVNLFIALSVFTSNVWFARCALCSMTVTARSARSRRRDILSSMLPAASASLSAALVTESSTLVGVVIWMRRDLQSLQTSDGSALQGPWKGIGWTDGERKTKRAAE